MLYYPDSLNQRQYFRQSMYGADHNPLNGMKRYQIARSRWEPLPAQNSVSTVTRGEWIQPHSNATNNPCNCAPNRNRIFSRSGHHFIPKIRNWCKCDRSEHLQQITTPEFYSEQPLEFVYLETR